ncbi:MAG TPA: GIY-YIG nuclease family protein [Micropepsaceae bacterium]|nr:GIY-YIG nuclease family protein [Micropepsaceae bacterium]
MPSFVYVLASDGKGGPRTYVGWTLDVEKRLAAHNAGRGARSTKGRHWQIVHVEKFRTRNLAMRREWHLKRDRKLRKALLAGFVQRRL